MTIRRKRGVWCTRAGHALHGKIKPSPALKVFEVRKKKPYIKCQVIIINQRMTIFVFLAMFLAKHDVVICNFV